MSRDTFLLAAPISATDPVQRCYLDLYGNTPHEPHAWAELTTPAPVGLVTALNKPKAALTGYQCPGRQPPPPFPLTSEQRRRMAEELIKGVEERWRESVRERFAPRPKLRFPFDLIDPATLTWSVSPGFRHTPTGE